MNMQRLSLDKTPPHDWEPSGTLRWDANLTEIADFYGSDKGSSDHNYTPIYEQHLSHLKSEPINLLEIGVACGASLKMWARYFPYAKITGLDIRPECAGLCQGYPNVEIKILDATKERQFGDWDVIVDDGSHLPGHIVKSFLLNWPWLKKGGKYFIEDLRCTHTPTYVNRFKVDESDKDRGTFLNLVDQLLRRMDNGGGDVAAIHFTKEMMVVTKG